MRKNKPFLVLLAEDLSVLLPAIYERSGNFDTIFAETAELQEHGVFAVDVMDPDAPLPAPDNFAGVFISGSAAMVTEQAPWMLRVQDWVREAAASHVPILGICFGHQLIASALGGRVGFATRPTYETVSVTVTPAGRDDPLLSVLPADVKLQSAHSQVVTELPANVAPLAHASPGIYAARFAKNIWGVQFHPETDHVDMAVTIEDVRNDLEANGIDADSNIASLEPTPNGPALMKRFRDIAISATNQRPA